MTTPLPDRPDARRLRKRAKDVRRVPLGEVVVVRGVAIGGLGHQRVTPFSCSARRKARSP